jgi:hypothetical protein
MEVLKMDKMKLNIMVQPVRRYLRNRLMEHRLESKVKLKQLMESNIEQNIIKFTAEQVIVGKLKLFPEH